MAEYTYSNTKRFEIRIRCQMGIQEYHIKVKKNVIDNIGAEG